MTDPIVIDKNRTLLPAQDYEFLRENGLDHIRDLSGKIWTDHNLHDPGITILEILCYALTDLGYRTAFDVRDLLAKADGTTDSPETSGLFPAHEVLTTEPLTIHDYRKLLLKVEGIRNAWLDPQTDPEQRETEVAIYADCQAGGLSYVALNASHAENPPVHINGLYKVLLELEIDDVLGSLNESRLVYQVKRGPLKGLVISLDGTSQAFIDGEIDSRGDLAHVVQVVSLEADGAQRYKVAARVQTAAGEEVLLDQLELRIVNDRPVATRDPLTVTPGQLKTVLGDSQPDAVTPLFWRKQQLRQQITDTVSCVLHAHRCLCEDFFRIRTVGTEHVAVCADIEVAHDADLEELQARVYFAIENYFNPPIHYYTLKELLDEGLGADDVFNSPHIDTSFTCGGEKVFTKPGFIKREDLEASELRRFVYVSDIINVLMDFEGIVAVRNVMLRKYDDEGNPVGPGEKWCLAIAPDHQPLLDIERSKILFFKDQLPFRARTREFEKTLDHLRAMARKAAYVEPNQVLPSPRGRYRQPDEFFSIQHDFPHTYGIGPTGLPAGVPATRVAQARQLKAYLTFYDQLLGDYLGQLAAVGHLFSLDKGVKQTYFSQYLQNIAGVREAFEDEFYVNKAALQEAVEGGRLIEDEELFSDRRNRMLDHLAARFAEQFTDYVLMMFSLDGDRLKTGKQLLDDKIDFLREYPSLSRERHQAFNYRPQNAADVWDTDNVSGLEKRVSRLVGIDSYLRRDLACGEHFGELFDTREVGGQHHLEIRRADGTVIFRSQEPFASRDAALFEAGKLYPVLRRENAYHIDASGGTGQVTYSIEADGPHGTTLHSDDSFETEADAVQNIRAIIDRYDEILLTAEACNDEGFHLIEHLLLRPLSNNDELMDVCIKPACEMCGDEDPYSFRIQVVLPYWPRRFQDLNFRRFFERTLRAETPAHIHVRICWISNEQMADLDKKYHAWLEAKAVKAPNPQQLTNLTEALRDLIRILQRLKTVYPAATLHDCEEGDDSNPVRLGNTNLGIF